VEPVNERKSSYSSGANGNCVAVGKLNNSIAIRDTKQANDAHRDMLTFNAEAWQRFINHIK
jgi:CRISPR/Cas system CMR-associated protein Cmr5 small subunit